MVTKQEKIRNSLIEFFTPPNRVKPSGQDYFDENIGGVVDKLLRRLHSLGVVIKVDRELPVMPPATDEELKARHDGECQFIRHGEYFNTWYCGLTGETPKTMKFCEKWNGGSCSPEEGISRFKAGYVAVEPLIEELDGNQDKR